MNAPIAFIDTETTSLRFDRRAWDVGLITRREDGFNAEHSWFVRTEDLDLGNADLYSLKIGRFHERHPDCRHDGGSLPERAVLLEVEQLTRGAHLVGCVPNFDAEVLAARMRAHGICPSWHYHLVDCETLAAGYLANIAGIGRAGLGAVAEPEEGWPHEPPWHSEELSQLVGVDPGQFDRHTALGDARWAMAIYDAVMNGTA